MNRRLTILGFVAGLAGASVFAAPATQPVVTPDYYLVPFTAIGNDNSFDWAGRAVEQNLLTDLARNKLHAVASDKAAPNMDDARSAANAAGAKYLISGTYQLAEQMVRFNGQIIDASTGQVLGGISATGAPRDLFNLEDSLSSQTLQQIAQMTVAVNNKPAGPVSLGLERSLLDSVLNPPAVGQVGAASSYDGSALQHYVDANLSPSTEFAQQVQDAQYRATYTPYNDFGYGYGGLYAPSTSAVATVLAGSPIPFTTVDTPVDFTAGIGSIS